MKKIQNYIHGSNFCLSVDELGVSDPSTGEEIRKVVLSNEKDFKKAIESSKKSFLEWSGFTPLKRSRILSNLEKLYLTIKKLSLKVEDNEDYFNAAHEAGIPIKNLKKLQNNLFGLEANFQELSAIDFKKGCYIGQENTARMKLKNKLRKKLLPLVSKEILETGSEITLEGNEIGKLLIANPYPFGLINIFNKNISELKNKEVLVGKQKAKII